MKSRLKLNCFCSGAVAHQRGYSCAVKHKKSAFDAYWYLCLSDIRALPRAVHSRSAMVYLDQNAFMSELSKLYTKTKTSGSVWVTMKRVTRPIVTGKRKLDDDGPMCIVRATDGSRKIACAVSAGDHLRFHMDLFTVIEANTENLKKPKRAKRSKNKAT